MPATGTTRGRLRAVRWTTLCCIATLVSLGAVAPAAVSHFLSNDSVDGREIRYEDYTVFDDARIWARDRWNALGRVKVAPDAWNTVTDLEIGDYRDSGTTTVGYWQPRTGADALKFNRHHLDGYSTGRRRNVSLHELGHAHGLAHSYCTTQVMCYHVNDNQSPQSHDRSDYYTRWP